MIQVTINYHKFWNVVAVLYIIGYIAIQIFISKYFLDVGSTIMLEAVVNLGLCQGIPLVYSINRLNNEYNLRSKLFPFYFRFNDHSSIEIQNLREDKQ